MSFTRRTNTNFWLGVLLLASAIFALFIWIPQDIESSIIEKVRSQKRIGDALAPTVACSMLAMGSLLLIFKSWGQPSDTELSLNNIKFLVILLALVSLSLLVMLYAGSTVLYVFKTLGLAEQLGDYRSLRDTAPWKYIGYFFGGFILVFGLIWLMQGRVLLKSIWITLAAVIALIALYDLPFDNLLLPPNGDF